MLASFLVQPRVGHLDQALHLFAYLKKHKKSTMVFDDNYANLSNFHFTKADWTEFYRDAAEQIPANAPTPRGKPVEITCFVDTDHAGDKLTRRSQTGILIFVNRAPITWYSKKQNTVETSSFGSEFVALRIATELIESLHYKLRMFGVPIDGPANVLCDNDAVVKNSSLPESTLKKKHNSIAYHRVREAVASGTLQVAKILSHENLADFLTKSTLSGIQLRTLLEQILF
jgi:hypothetical protein